MPAQLAPHEREYLRIARNQRRRLGTPPAGDDELVLDQVISSTNSKLLGALPSS